MTTVTNQRNTSLSTLFPSVMFANVSNDLGQFDISIPNTVNIYIIDPIEVTASYFRKAFYAENSGDLKYFKPGAGNTSVNDPKDIAILKNLLFLNSGGGMYTDASNVQTPLVKKTITFSGNPAEEFVINSFIIQDIEDTSNQTYDAWSVDSQIDLSRKLSAFSYIYDFPINLTGDTLNTNALTWNQLKKTVNLYIYKYYNETGTEIPATKITPVILNFVVGFKTIIGLGVDLPSEETNTQVLYQYKVTDWLFETIDIN